MTDASNLSQLTEDEDYCCEEHFPSSAMSLEDQLEHFCPRCGWAVSDD